MFRHGVAAAALGLAMHFAAAAIFYLLSRRIPALLHHAAVSGILYGAVVYLEMCRAVLPLTIVLKSIYLATFNAAWPCPSRCR